jgi:hypothetical protein
MNPQGILTHAGPYEFSDIGTRTVLPLLGSTQTFMANIPGSLVGAVWQWDDHFNVTRIRITAGQAVSYRLETIACVEYVLNPNTAFSRVSLPSPPASPMSVLAVDSAIAKVPAATTAAQSESIIQRLLRGAAKVAPIVGSIFGPEGTLIGGGVSAITSALAEIL